MDVSVTEQWRRSLYALHARLIGSWLQTIWRQVGISGLERFPRFSFLYFFSYRFAVCYDPLIKIIDAYSLIIVSIIPCWVTWFHSQVCGLNGRFKTQATTFDNFLAGKWRMAIATPLLKKKLGEFAVTWHCCLTGVRSRRVLTRVVPIYWVTVFRIGSVGRFDVSPGSFIETNSNCTRFHISICKALSLSVTCHPLEMWSWHFGRMQTSKTVCSSALWRINLA